MGDDAGAKLGGFDAAAEPEFPAVRRIKGAELAVGVHDEFVMPIDLDDGRRVPGRRKAADAPHGLSSFAIKREELVAFVRRIHDEQISIKDGRRTNTPVVRLFSDADIPDRFAIDGVGKHASISHEKEHAFAIRDRRARCVAVRGDVGSGEGLVRQIRRNLVIPKNLAGLSIEAQGVALQVLHVARILHIDAVAAVAGEEDLAAADDRAR